MYVFSTAYAHVYAGALEQSLGQGISRTVICMGHIIALACFLSSKHHAQTQLTQQGHSVKEPLADNSCLP